MLYLQVEGDKNANVPLKNKPGQTATLVCFWFFFSKINMGHNHPMLTNIFDVGVFQDMNFRVPNRVCACVCAQILPLCLFRKFKEKSPVISSAQYLTSSVPHTGYGTLDLANLDAAVGASYH